MYQELIPFRFVTYKIKKLQVNIYGRESRFAWHGDFLTGRESWSEKAAGVYGLAIPFSQWIKTP